MRPIGPEAPFEYASPIEHLPSKEVIRLSAHDGPVLAVRFNRQGTYCMSCGKRKASANSLQDRKIKLWNPEKGICVKTYTGHGYDVRDVAIDKDNSKFSSCGGDRQVFLWDVTSGSIIRKFRGHDGPVNSVRYSPNAEVIVSGGYDKAVKVWDCRSRSVEPVQVMQHFSDSVMSVVVSNRSDILAGSIDGTVRRFDVRMGRLITDLVHNPITCVAVASDGNIILTACMDSCIRLLDRADGDLLSEYRGHLHRSTKVDVSFTPKDGYVVACSEDGRIVYWDVVEGNKALEFTAHAVTVCSLAMHPEGKRLLTSSLDGTLKVWA